MRFQRCGDGVVELSHAAREHLLAHRQLDARATEAGGILLGRLIAGTADIVIDYAKGPTERDRRTRSSFFRARKPAQAAIDTAWTGTNHTLNYLGEWHTHPQDEPEPSTVDQKDWQRTVKRATFEQPSLIFIIVGRRVIRAWELKKSDPVPQLLPQIVT